MRTNSVPFLVSILVLCVVGLCHGDGLKKHFYKKSCPQAEDIIRKVVWKNVAQDATIPAGLVRLHYHDCFVRGCDGSVLLNSTKDHLAERDAQPNLTLDGFEVVDEAKDAVDKACPGVVSCADILALAARDAVAFQFKKPMWKVLTGRRDGRVSIAKEAVDNLPPPSFNFAELVKNFASKGLDVHDLVVLSGAHTIGQAHCESFFKRLHKNHGGAEKSLDPKYAAFLASQCPNLSNKTTQVDMDPQSAESFDNHYYVNLKQHKGLFHSDAALLTNKKSEKIVNKLLDQKAFFKAFAHSMKKMGAIEVLTGNSGEVRKKCTVVN
ncbi:PREDICTED: peroxidase 3-like [Nelumbo nucifera]|uniref:Peroxidase n=2 Tax=Nelumbo nucifera TaxID=4432 RepID=A0A1U7ZFA2_NELNU|nr:PREDICTED: peroxidase 3-like [Nelumbo nucifera]DAD44894.1 TPA_asm: hypothetical protein HUJ06_003124 [Nelumbo nucifera]